jgi:hypothetical protein
VNCDHSVENGGGDALKRKLAADARVIDENVDGAEPSTDVRDEADHGSLIDHVARGGINAASNGFNFTDNMSRPALIPDMTESNFAAFRSESAHDRRTDAAAAAGDESNAAVQSGADLRGIHADAPI